MDVWVNASGVAFVGAETYAPGGPTSYTRLTACATPPGHVYQVEIDQPSGLPGAVVNVNGCNAQAATCTTVVGDTGAEVDPATTTDAPLSGGTTTGGSAGLATGTCVYVDGGTPTCPFGVTILGVTVNEADLVPVVTPHTPTPPCTGVNGTCVPVGASVGLFQDKSNPTAEVTTATSSTAIPVDVAPTGVCLHVNAPACP